MIRWFARNHIAANFLLVAILLGGIWSASFWLPLEVRPAYTFNHIDIDVEYRGATPEDVETTLAIPIERALEGMPGVTRIDAEIRPGSIDVDVEISERADLKGALEEVERRVKTINFPPEIEQPDIEIPTTDTWWEVITVVVASDVSESELLRTAHQIRDEVMALPDISQVQLRGNRAREISIEADPAVLRSYRLSLEDLNEAVRRASIDLPAGSIDTPAGNLLLRTKSQAYSKEDFANIIVTAADGAEIRLGEIATITDGFEQGEQILRYNGVPALRLEVLRTGNESALKISDAVRSYVERKNTKLADGVSLHIWDDESISLRGRLSTLMWSLAQGAFLVLLLLGLFLRPMLAFWVVIGIPVSFAGGLLLMPWFDMTLNMWSLFGFIIVVGIVVDDAIVTGENIFTKLREGQAPLEAAVVGTKEVATPVTFGILTTIVAFLPLSLAFDGFYGNITKQIPPVVAGVLLFSLIESKLVLPTHLKNLKTGRTKLNSFARFQKWFADALERFVEKVYQPTLEATTRHRYITLACFAAVAMAAWGYWNSGRLGKVLMPSIDRYQIYASVNMTNDTKFDRTDEMVAHMIAAAEQLKNEFVDKESGESLIQAILSGSGTSGRGWGTPSEEEGFVALEILPPSLRGKESKNVRNEEIESRWRELIGKVPDVRALRIWGQQRTGRYADYEAIEVELRGPDSPEKLAVANAVEELFEARTGEIADAWNDLRNPREELEIKLKPRARELGLTELQLARQIRGSFFGAEAQRIQRDREEIRVMVRLSEASRDNLHALESLRISTGQGPAVPFSHVATLTPVKAPPRIERIDGARVARVSAQAASSNLDVVRIADQEAPRIDALVSKVPGLSWRYQGFVAEHKRSEHRKNMSYIALFIALYALLAIPFKSLSQPLFVLLAVPFGMIGAILGHIILGETPSFFSSLGMLAMAGVVVNDSLVMVDFTNQRVRAGEKLRDAVLRSGAARFRPILLTSLTTFVGLLPLILDSSIQAKFLIPMAISLGFGVLFATVITLYLIPCAYLVNEDAKQALARAWAWYKRPFLGPESPEPPKSA